MSSRHTGIGRRRFLELAGAVGLAAGCSPRAATQTIVPLLVPEEGVVPGVPVHYRTVCRECPAGCGVTARTREGRVVKLEGNPEDPIGAGALCARGQASLQALYHPERFAGPQRRGPNGALVPVSWDEGEGALASALEAARKKGPGRIRLLTRLEPGSAGAVQVRLLQALEARPADRVVLEPLDLAPLRAAGLALFGRAELPVLDLSAARSVVSFGADFLETWLSPVEQARQFAAGRGRLDDQRIRLTWIGPRLSLTGVSADRWVRVRAGGELALALGLLRWVTDPASAVPGLAPEAGSLHAALAPLSPAGLAASAGISWEEIVRLGRELARRRPSALIGPGPASQGPDATRLAAAVLLLNLVLGNLGQTVHYGLDPRADVPSTAAEVEALIRDLARGEVDVLLVHHADPVGTLPAVLHAAEAMGRVPLVVSFALRPDPTTDRAHLILPDRHDLESFGDVTPRRGVAGLAQPVMTPLSDSRPASQVLLEIAARLPLAAAHLPWKDFREVTLDRNRVLARGGGVEPASLDAAVRAAQQRGGHYHDASADRVRPALRPGSAEPFLAGPEAPRPPALDELDLVVFPTALRGDGRGADLPWRREIPDTLSSVSWSPWAELSPVTAGRLGLATGDLVALTGPGGTIEVPAYVFPGIRDDAVAVPLGGPEALVLLPGTTDAASGAQVLTSTRVRARRAGQRMTLPILEGSPYQHGRSIVPTVSAASPSVKRPDLSHTMYDRPKHPEHRWAMTIDLDSCNGCQACVVACFAENNVPVMGAEAATRGRYMGWLRIERYLGDEPGEPLDVSLLPMLCQQCDNAPCEPVCPVYATYHTAEGLNAQVYNRCVGTRYCSNNCPYKVRTFNWRDTQFERPLSLQLNPDVTVRSRGIMEKCTFCVQRIRYGKNQARDEGRAVADGDVVPACAQTCPAQAITFGDANDPNSRVSRKARNPRAFRALEEINTQPAVTYLARVRNEEES